MAIKSNFLIPVLVGAFGLMAVGIAYRTFSSDDGPVKAGEELTAVPSAHSAASGVGGRSPLMKAKRADGDKPNETMQTLTVRINSYEEEVARLRLEQKERNDELDRLRAKADADEKRRGQVDPVTSVANGLPGTAPSAGGFDIEQLSKVPDPAASSLSASMSQVERTLGTLAGGGQPKSAKQGAPMGIPPGLGFDGQAASMQDFPTHRNQVASVSQGAAGGEAGTTPSTREPGYVLIKPLGYEQEPAGRGRGKDAAEGGRLVRVALGGGVANGAAVAETTPAKATASQPPAPPESVPYFTIPENATLTRLTAMTSVVGRVPVDGKVQDPMEFKAIVGRDNLAASGFEMPDDLSGIVVSGVAMGDMAMSCSEGHVHSMTFVFDDGTVRTVSSSKSGRGGSPRENALGYISDIYGNPCVSGRFVSNAPAHIADASMLRGLGIASSAYAGAQTTTTESAVTGGTSTSVTGSRGAYVLGQAAAGAVDEVTNWLTSRMKNSFDAVVTPSGEKLVLHIKQEIAIDKMSKGRRLDHRSAARAQMGAHHGLE